jgi:hypothetical protein
MIPTVRVEGVGASGIVSQWSADSPAGLGGAAVEFLRMRHPELSAREAACELWDFIVLAVADRIGPPLQYPSSCWFDAGCAALKTVTASWDEVDAPTQRFLDACDWYLRETGPLDGEGCPYATTIRAVDETLMIGEDCSDSILLPVRLQGGEEDHIIGLHMCAEGDLVHLVFLDSAPCNGDALGLEQSCAMHLKAERSQVLEWLASPVGVQILMFQGLDVSSLEDLTEEIAPWLGPLDWSPAAWAFHQSQVQNSCVPMMTQLAWSLEYVHPRMGLPSRTQGHVQSGWTAARWQRGLCEMATDLAGFLARPASDVEPFVDALTLLVAQREPEISFNTGPNISLPAQLRGEVFEALASVSLESREHWENSSAIDARARRHAQQCLKHLAVHLGRLESSLESSTRQALWLVGRWSRSVTTDPGGRLEPLSDLSARDRRLLNLVRTLMQNLSTALSGYRPAIRRWARRMLSAAQQLPALYPELEPVQSGKTAWR